MAPPYGLAAKEKDEFLLGEMNALTRHHMEHCQAYKRLITTLELGEPPYASLASVPFLPVDLFKKYDLMSIPGNEVFKTLLSSGTTGTVPSKIYLDRATAQSQTKALVRILSSFIGSKRLPMLIVDSDAVFSDRSMFSARGAAILGLLTFGIQPFYLLDEQMRLKKEALRKWVNTHAHEPVLIFGFTFMVWKHLLSVLNSREIELPYSFLLHTGGWKKMHEQSIDNKAFKAKIGEVLGCTRCHNFYGMIEQTGSIFMECEHGRLHASDYGDIIIRDPSDWQSSRSGILQVLSTLPRSYPGHSLLTGDLGKLIGIDDCPCGRKGKTFEVIGRVPKSEPRGCSDAGP